MNLEEQAKAIEEVLKEQYWDRDYWKAHLEIKISPATRTNREETEIIIEALEYKLKDIQECLKQGREQDEKEKNERYCKDCDAIIGDGHNCDCKLCGTKN